MDRLTIICAAVLSVLVALPAHADFAVVSTKAEFVRLVGGKTLSRPLIKLQVSENGQIRGKGARWPVAGTWSWQNGYFCRDLFWGDSALVYNCQEVRAKGNKVRFTSDRGVGDFADFRVNQP